MTRKRRRLALLGATVTVALAAVAQAVAAIAPKLDATTQASGTTISYSQAATDDAPAQVSFFVPARYTLTLTAAEGAAIGSVKATAVAADLGGATLQLAGPITAARGTTVIPTQTVPLGVVATVCTGTAAHSAFWVVNLTTAGQTLQVPAFVDELPAAHPLAKFAKARITICLPPPDVPPGTPGRATFGAKVTSANLTLNGVFSVVDGWHLWHTLVTPYSPGIGKANAAGTVSVQSYDRTPQVLTISSKASGTTAKVSGRLTAGGRAVPGADVTILAGKKALGTTKTGPGGRYKATVTLPSASTTPTASATSPARPATCQQGFFGPVPCAGAQFAGFTVASS